MDTLRDQVEILYKSGGLRCVSQPVSAEFEIAGYTAAHFADEKSLLFEQVEGYSDFRVLTELMLSQERIAQLLGLSPSELLQRISQAQTTPGQCEEASPHFYQKELESIYQLPLLRHFPEDGGRYITGGVIIAANQETGFENLSFHRLLALSDKRMAFCLHPGKHLDILCRQAEQMDVPLPVAILIGADPAVLLAGSSPIARGIDELRVAAAMKGSSLPVARCKNVPLWVPAQTEIVIEGHVIPGVRETEGPFVDYLGVMHSAAPGRVIQIESISCRNNAIYHAIMPSNAPEHLSLMATPVEAELARRIAMATTLVDVCLTRSSNLFHAAAAIRKSTDGEAKNVLLSMLSAYPFIKHAVVVDEHVDIRDPRQVEYAIATCFQAASDLVVINGAKGTIVDPSLDHDSLLSSKVGIDATRSKRVPESALRPVTWPETPYID